MVFSLYKRYVAQTFPSKKIPSPKTVLQGQPRATFQQCPTHLYQVMDSLELAIQHSLMQGIAVVALKLAVHVEAVSDQQSNDVVVPRLGRQEKSSVGHV